MWTPGSHFRTANSGIAEQLIHCFTPHRESEPVRTGTIGTDRQNYAKKTIRRQDKKPLFVIDGIRTCIFSGECQALYHQAI
jgi:hypothetical protein